MPLLTLLGQAATNVTIGGGTAQLGAITSSGTLQTASSVGGTNQLGAISSSGTLIVGLTIGGTSQLTAFTSSGGIQVGENVGAGGTSNRLKKKRENLEELRRASQLALLRRRKAEELEAKVEAQIEKAVPAGATIEYDPQAMRIAKITDKIDQALAIAFEAQRQAEEEQEQTRKRRQRDQIAVMLLLH